MTRYIPRESQCLSEAKEVPRVQPSALPRLHSSTDLSRGIEGVISPAGEGYVYLMLCLGYSVQSLRSNGMRLAHVAGYMTRYLPQTQQSDWSELPKYSIRRSYSHELYLF